MSTPPSASSSALTDATHENWVKLKDLVEGFLNAASINENLSYERFFPVFHNAVTILTKNVSISTPSVFKQAAAFILSFIAESPLRTPFPPLFDSRLINTANHQNAVVAFEYMRFGLVGATIHHSTRGKLILNNKIQVSRHYYFDLIHALTCLGKSENGFHLTSLLIESLAYKSNPGTADDEVV
jgi:hypothetical protein